MERIVAAVLAVASVIAAFVLGRKSRSSHDDGERDIRRAFDDLRETAEEMGAAGDRASTASDGIGGIAEGIGSTVPVAHGGREDAERQDELIAELRRRDREGSEGA